jgi:N-acetylglucosaminyldiphosphoundecaprenol N-acetyl-beta-D-mannosaminyltransferase
MDPGAIITPASVEFLLESVDFWIRERRSGKFLIFFEGNLLSRLKGNPDLARALVNADFVVADGIAPATLASWTYGKKVQRIPGPDFMPKACEYGVARRWRHFLYGGDEGVAERLSQILAERFPGILVVGAYCPPFRPLSATEDEAVCEMIERSGADIVWVALGGPKQEIWMNEHAGRLRVPVMMGIGAAFDFLTGTRPRAPVLVRRLGLEWIFRMVTGGPRLFVRNLRVAVVSSWMLMQAWLRRKAVVPVQKEKAG